MRRSRLRSRSCLLALALSLASAAPACSSRDDADDGAHTHGTSGDDGVVGVTTRGEGSASAGGSRNAASADSDEEAPLASPTGAVSPRDPTAAATTPGASSTVPRPSTDVQAGTLTAGAWDDNVNFTHFLAYRDSTVQRLGSDALTFTREEIELAKTAFAGPRAARQKLDIALMIDTTGSMGDELRYLQTELSAISRTVQEKYPSAEQRWALVFYRDQGDEYVTRVFDFTSDVEVARTNLAGQSAGGGGDFPEAPEAAFVALNQLAWRSDAAVARLTFWVADAPHHAGRVAALSAAVRDARQRDVRVYPVASSGIDDLTELSMRSAAQLTGGRYVFLTDDSGVGGAHQEPSIPCHFVTRLDRALLRMIDAELTGTATAPAASEVLRTGGDVQSGACKLASGQEVRAL